MALIYAAADLFVAPSVQDNLPNTVLEALACGTPCAAFNIGGIPDMIEHKQNGYLAEAMDAHDLSRGIVWILKDKSRFKRLSLNAVRKVAVEFDDRIISQRYASLFEKLLSRNR